MVGCADGNYRTVVQLHYDRRCIRNMIGAFFLRVDVMLYAICEIRYLL